MTQKRSIYALIIIGLISAIALLLLLNMNTQVETSDVALTVTFESTGFRMAYPEGWQHNVPQTGMFFLGDPNVLQLQPGASMVIQRSLRLTGDAESLVDALEIYMENGPLLPDKAWNIVEAISETTFADREAVIVALEGAEGADAVAMRSEIIVTYSDNRFIYVFAMSAPLEQWEAIESTFDAILASVTLLE